MPQPKLEKYHFERAPKDAYENAGIPFLLKIYHFKKLLRLLIMSVFNAELASEQKLPVESQIEASYLGLQNKPSFKPFRRLYVAK
jgi:hypothetical protein